MADTLEQLNNALAGRYAIQRELGRGGMATVFLADDLRHRRPVAIKVLQPELAALIGPDRFLREIEIAARLQHPHILNLLDSGEASGLLYYVMPYVAGESLRERLSRERQLPVEDALRLGREVADALEYAHGQGVVHRDIKPENILLQAGHAVVADFGIAHAVGAAGGTKLTTAGTVLGTPAYMSPEQVMGSQELDGRSDVYSLGCVLYEMLAGVPPFAGATGESLAHQHLSVVPPPVTTLRPAVPEATARALAKALAKTPADRFASPARFAEALTTSAEIAPSGPGGIRRKRHAAAVAWLAALAVAALTVWSQWDWIWAHFPRHATRKEWVMVAEFDGPADDPSLAAATRDLVSAALDQSTSLATVSQDQIRTGLQLADKPPATRVDAALARELAYRKGVRAVVEGSIRRLGAGAALVVRVRDVERDSVLFSVSDVAPNEQALIAMIGRVSRRIREDLGERKDAIRQNRELVEVRTASFEAFKDYQQATQLVVAGDSYGAIAQCRAALALDPDFAAASNVMGYAFINIGQVDSALVAWRYSLKRPGRLSESVRLITEAAVADVEGDFPLALATFDRLAQQDPAFASAHNNRGWLLYRTGQYEAALGSLARAAEASPFGSNQITLQNQFISLLALGRHDEARAVAGRLRGEFAQGAAVWMAAASGNWASAESLGTVLESPTASLEMRRLGALAIASAAATRGEVRAAERALRRAETLRAASIPAARVSMQAVYRARLLLALVSGSVAGDPDGGWPRDTTAAALVTRGLWAAAAGDTPRARRFLATVQFHSAGERARAGADPALLEASIAAREGRWEETLRILGPAARQGSEIGLAEDHAGRVTLRWLVAGAYENLGRPDSAATYLELVLSPLGRVDQEYFARGIAFPFAHQRLVLLYARMGRLEEARRHWEIFSGTFTRPDPELAPLLAEARAALAGAEGMVRSARR